MLFIFILLAISSIAQEQLGLPGDDLNLYSVLNLFQKSPTLEIFEKNINLESYRINNLDINDDGKIDYIHVFDYVNNNAHFIVLRVNINGYESQDVAVIEVEKVNDKIQVHIIGDEKLYGKYYIVEPNDTNPPYQGEYIIEPVSSWIIFSYIYHPYYVVYTSPYYWGYYPFYWNTWAPIYYNNYYNYHRHYYNYYRRSYYYHPVHNYYVPRRVTTNINRSLYRPNNYHPSNYPINKPSNYNNNHPTNYQHNRYDNNYQQPYQPSSSPRQSTSPRHQPSSSPSHSGSVRKTR